MTYKLQILELYIKDCHFSELSTDVWVSLTSLTSLNCICMESSSLALSYRSLPFLPSVNELSTKRVSSESYSGLIMSLPGLKKMGHGLHLIYLADADKDIAQISLGLRHLGASLTHIELDGRFASERKVSDCNFKCLCEVIIEKVTKLEMIWFANLTMDEQSLIDLIKTCRAITTMKEIW